MNKARLIKIIKEEIKKVLLERPLNRRAAAAMDDLDAELANVGSGDPSDIAAILPSEEPEPQAQPKPKPKSKPKPKPKTQRKGRVRRQTTDAALPPGMKFKRRREGKFVIVTAIAPDGRKAEGKAKIRSSSGNAANAATLRARTAWARKHMPDSTKTTISDR